ncbi:hypothetical protein D3C84_955530 [compost metagenome]
MAPSMAMEKAAGSSRSMAARFHSTGAPSGPGRAQGITRVGAMGGIPMPWVPSARV